MSPRPRGSSAPGRGRPGAGRRRVRDAPATRRTSRVEHSPQSPRTTASARSKLTGRAAILALILAVLAVSYASSVRAWLKQRSDVNTLTAEIASRRAQVAELEQSKRRWHDPAYIETQARLRFGWVLPGEIGYHVIGADGQVWTDGTRALSAPDAITTASPQEWWQREWGSVVQAAKTPEQVAAATLKKPRPAARIGPQTHPQHR
ncbi:MAG: FtsB family cell division protein [Nocardioidaceae bacterium]